MQLFTLKSATGLADALKLLSEHMRGGPMGFKGSEVQILLVRLVNSRPYKDGVWGVAGSVTSL